MPDDWFKSAAADMEAEVEEIQAEADLDEWDPEPGDILNGVFLKAIPKPTKYGIGYLVLVKDLENNDETVKVWASRKTLKEGLIGMAPAQGAMLSIKYVGLMDGYQGNAYNLYQVRANEEDRGLWNALQEEGARKQAQFKENQDAPDLAPEDLEAPF